MLNRTTKDCLEHDSYCEPTEVWNTKPANYDTIFMHLKEYLGI